MNRNWKTSAAKLLAANPKVVAEVKEGKPKGLGQLIGQAKKKNPECQSESVPGVVREADCSGKALTVFSY